MVQEGVNVSRIHEQMYKHKSRAEPYMMKARATSSYLNPGKDKKVGEGNGEIDVNAIADDAINDATAIATDAANQAADAAAAALAEKQAQLVDAAIYYELMFLGIIDGLVSNFNVDCRSGLSESVKSLFSVVKNLPTDPRKFAKFNIANTGLTEATNMVYAYCDTSPLANNLSTLTNYDTNTEQYIVLWARLSGLYINTYPEMMKCINDGKRKGNGYDVGYCGSNLVSLALDTKL